MAFPRSPTTRTWPKLFYITMGSQNSNSSRIYWQPGHRHRIENVPNTGQSWYSVKYLTPPNNLTFALIYRGHLVRHTWIAVIDKEQRTLNASYFTVAVALRLHSSGVFIVVNFGLYVVTCSIFTAEQNNYLNARSSQTGNIVINYWFKQLIIIYYKHYKIDKIYLSDLVAIYNN